ncbi:MAG: lanthionine synthetase LanC family protein [Candidatus Thorarchaeota archaeon]
MFRVIVCTLFLFIMLSTETMTQSPFLSATVTAFNPSNTNISILNTQKSKSINNINSLFNELKQKSGISIQYLVHSLYNLSESTSTGITWSQEHSTTPRELIDASHFYGQRGLASIGLTFIDLYNFDHNYTYLVTANQIANYLFVMSKNSNSGIFWVKSKEDSTNWIGTRYGNAGIIPFYLKLYQTTNNETYLSIANQAANFLINIAQNNGTNKEYWLANGEKGYIITDYYYGVSGIIDCLLQIYDVTHNSTYLTYAIAGGNFLNSLILKENVNSNTGYIPWTISPVANYDQLVFTGYLNGQAGIGQTFLYLYDHTNTLLWLESAITLGNWLITQDKNDSGLYNSAGSSYLTHLSDVSGNIIGFGSGSLGIANFYLNIYQHQPSNIWLYKIIRIMNLIEKVTTKVSKGSIIPYQYQENSENEYLMGRFSGLSGVVGILAQFNYYFNNSEYWNQLDTFVTTLSIYINQYNGFLPFEIGTDIINVNGEDGIASMINSLLLIENLSSLTLGSLSQQYNQALLSIPPPQITYPPSQKEGSTGNLSIYFGDIISSLILIGIIISVKKHKTK